jgi:hypothetical protein
MQWASSITTSEGGGTPRQLLKARRIATLRRDINQLAGAAFDFIVAATNLRRIERAVEGRDLRKAAPGKPLDLILHQRDQRRDDQRPSFQQLRRQLITERFAQPRRQHGKRMPPRQHVLDHLTLARTKLLEAEMFAQCELKLVHPLGIGD